MNIVKDTFRSHQGKTNKVYIITTCWILSLLEHVKVWHLRSSRITMAFNGENCDEETERPCISTNCNRIEKCPLFSYSTYVYASNTIWKNTKLEKEILSFLRQSAEMQITIFTMDFNGSIMTNYTQTSHEKWRNLLFD